MTARLADGLAWEAIPYIKQSGRCQVLDFFEGLKSKSFKDHLELTEIVIPRLEETGPMMVGPPHWEGVGDGLYEIRCKMSPPARLLLLGGRQEDRDVFRV